MSIYVTPTGTNIEASAQRTDILHFMEVTAAEEDAEAVYQQLGSGFMAMTESPSAQTKERKYINEKSSRKNITSYAPSFAFEAQLMFNNPAIRRIYDIYTKRKTGTDAIVTMITVDAFDTADSGYYPARKGNYAVEVSSCDDDDDMIIKGNFNGQGDEQQGWFNPTGGVWADDAPTAEAAADDTTAEESVTDDTNEEETAAEDVAESE